MLDRVPEGGWNRVDVVEARGPVAVIGDIHGRADLLDALLSKLGDLPLFVVGDVNDRGPDTQKVIDVLVRRGARGVRGNHEGWLCALAPGDGFDVLALSPMMGGVATLASYGIVGVSTREVESQVDRIPPSHRDWLTSLPVAMRLIVDGQPFWIAHAGVSATLCAGIAPIRRMNEIARSEHWDLLWRSQTLDEMDVLDGPVISGHVPRDEPVDAGHVVAIDTGSGKPNGRLTAVVLPTRRFVTVGEGDR